MMEQIKNKNVELIKRLNAFVQIFIFICAIFSFSYIIGNSLGNGEELIIEQNELGKNKKNSLIKIIYELVLKSVFSEKTLVSAQNQEISDETFERFRDHDGFKNYYGENLTDEQIENLLIDLEESGRITRDDFNNPDKVVDVLNSVANDYSASAETGNAAVSLLKLVSGILLLLGGVPESQQLAGVFLNSLREKTGGIYMCPEDFEGKFCQPYPAKNCNEVCKTECIEVDLTRNELPEDSECKLGTCYDKVEGTCQDHAPKGLCPNNEVSHWYPKGSSEATNMCSRGCCIIGDSTLFYTEQECRNKIEYEGLEYGEETSIWKGEISKQPECVNEGYRLRSENKLGSCLFKEQNEFGELVDNCIFTTGAECSQLNGDSFEEDVLCSSITEDCSPMNYTSCVENKDEVYWFDSCDNIENIYEGSTQEQKDSSYNDGKVKKKEESCRIGENEDFLKNQGTCGNCNHFYSSICGDKTEEQKLDDESQDVVCLDTGCTDDLGNRRENGESWCAYQAHVGLDGIFSDSGSDTLLGYIVPQNIIDWIGGDRSTDAPGSSHFKKVCKNGKIEFDGCRPGREEICKEERQQINGTDRTISTAYCQMNRQDECLVYNPNQQEGKLIGMAGPIASQILKAKLDLTCGLDPDCFVKDINVGGGLSSPFNPLGQSDTFRFSYCAPRYPKGFDIKNEQGEYNPEDNQAYCQQASQACVAVFVFEISGWVCKANCHCVEGIPGSAKPSLQFVRAMNNFCVSLGDCGSKANYVGDLPGSIGYSAFAYEGTNMFDRVQGQLRGALSSAIDISSYLDLNALTDTALQYDKPKKNLLTGEYYYIPANQTLPFGIGKQDKDEFFSRAGITDFFRSIDSILAEGLSAFSGGGGEGKNFGIPDISTGYEGGIPDAALISGGAGAIMGTSAWISAGGLGALTSGGVTVTIAEGSTAHILSGFGNFFMGFGIGMAVTGFLIDILGIGPGISKGMAYTLMFTGGIGAGIIGAQMAGFWGTAATNPIGWILIAVVAIVLVFLKVMGVGEIAEISVEFQCKPWTPPRDGSVEKCGSCGKDELSDGSNEFPCSKYACEALAQDCVYIKEEEGKNGGICEYSPSDDVNSPIIVSLDNESLTEGYEYDNFNRGVAASFEVKREDRKCMSKFSQIRFGFALNEWAECRIKAIHPEGNFDQMATFGKARNQTFLFRPLDLEDLGYLEPLETEQENDIKLFIACADHRGNNNAVNPFVVELCVTPQDLQVPIVDIVNDDGILPFDAQDHVIDVELDERAECKWDYIDIDFEDMQYEMNCNLFNQCTDLVNLLGQETEICIKCKDHPEWEGTVDENRRNVWTECIDGGTTLVKSESALKALLIKPKNDDKIISGTLGRPVNIEVQTSGGVDGNAACSYSIDNSGFLEFLETGGTIHEQCLGCGTAALSEGVHNLSIICEDSASPPNVARNESIFTIELDYVPPKIARVYQESGRLFVVADEAVSCSYLNTPLEGTSNPCFFNVDQGESMNLETGTNFLVHSTKFDENKIYYIKCKDHPEWTEDQEQERNEPTSCNIVVQKGLF